MMAEFKRRATDRDPEFGEVPVATNLFVLVIAAALAFVFGYGYGAW